MVMYLSALSNCELNSGKHPSSVCAIFKYPARADLSKRLGNKRTRYSDRVDPLVDPTDKNKEIGRAEQGVRWKEVETTSRRWNQPESQLRVIHRRTPVTPSSAQHVDTRILHSTTTRTQKIEKSTWMDSCMYVLCGINQTKRTDIVKAR